MFSVIPAAKRTLDESQMDRNAALSHRQVVAEERLGKTK